METSSTNIVDLKREGIYYAETGPNQTYVNLVQSTDENGDPIFNFVAAVAENSLMNTFTSSGFGKVICTVPLVEMLRMLEDSLRNRTTRN